MGLVQVAVIASSEDTRGDDMLLRNLRFGGGHEGALCVE